MVSPRIFCCAVPLLILLIVAPTGPPPRASELTRPPRVQLHWSSAQGRFDATGNALGMVGDTLLLDRLVIRGQGASAPEEVALVPRVYFADMDWLELSRGTRGNAMSGAVVGIVVGAVLGAVVFSSRPSQTNPSNDNSQALTVLGGSLLCGVIGAGVGSAGRSERWERVHPDTLRRLIAH